MVWNYNYTAQLHQRHINGGMLSVDQQFERRKEEDGWLPCLGLALSYVWTEQEWTCQERLEYDSATKRYQVGTRKWKGLEKGLEFCEYQDISVHLLQHDKEFGRKGLPPCVQQDIEDIFREVRKRIN